MVSVSELKKWIFEVFWNSLQTNALKEKLKSFFTEEKNTYGS